MNILIMKQEWNGFNDGLWTKEINVSDFIKKNYKGYDGDESFLAGPTEKTKRVLKVYEDMCIEEVKKHVIDIDTEHCAGINAFAPGYICEDDDVIEVITESKELVKDIVDKTSNKNN